MAKRRQQKGRKHRTVNRTPRPVSRSGAARTPVAAAPTGREGAARAATRPAATATTPATAPAAPAPAAPAPAPSAAAADAPVPAGRTVPDAELFAPASSGGLGRSAARTWEQLRAGGATGLALEELAERAGYQPATVGKHLGGLADRGLAELREERWYPAASSAVPA